MNEFVLMSKHLMEINSTVTTLPLAVSFKGFGFFKGQMIQQMGTVMEMQKLICRVPRSIWSRIPAGWPRP